MLNLENMKINEKEAGFGPIINKNPTICCQAKLGKNLGNIADQEIRRLAYRAGKILLEPDRQSRLLASTSRPANTDPGAGDARVDIGGVDIADVRRLEILVQLLLLLLFLLFTLLVALPALLLPLLLLLLQGLLGPFPVKQEFES